MIDQEELRLLMYRYSDAIDNRDWKMYRSCFTENAIVKVVPGSRQWPIDELIALIGPQFANFSGTQHIVTNHMFKIEGDKATGTCYLRASHWCDVPGKSRESVAWIIDGKYSDEYVRDDDGWKISIRTCSQSRSEGSYREVVSAGS